MSKPPGGARDGTVSLPSIPAKRYFTIGEVSDLCAVKPHVLRYWEQEFTQLKPIKRRGNRRYYQHHEVLLIRRIRELLYEQGFTINGARNRLDGAGSGAAGRRRAAAAATDVALDSPGDAALLPDGAVGTGAGADRDLSPAHEPASHATLQALRAELEQIRALLAPAPAPVAEENPADH
jgi:DNA-binding transcriptional MerR regulator